MASSAFATAPSTFKSSLTITHIGTATAILDIGGIKFLTDPVFSPAGSEWDLGVVQLKVSGTPAFSLQDLPPIDAVLLSHEDHPDNLDEPGRQTLDGRRVFTTNDGAKKLAPRPGVVGLSPWEKASLDIGGRHFEITGTPCEHLPGGECTGFVISSPEFGESEGKPNAIWFSGDTVYMEEHKQIADKFNVLVAIMNIGAVKVNGLQITFDGKQAAQLFRELKANVLVPMHYEWWAHFTENAEQLAKAFDEEGIADKVCWLRPIGQPKNVV